jgi:PDZ domain-containing protein
MKIMGTGTIDKDGTVGPICGVKYKVLGAYNSGADVFICPADNYKEALKTIKDNHLKLKLIKVSNFDEAIEKLKNIS